MLQLFRPNLSFFFSACSPPSHLSPITFKAISEIAEIFFSWLALIDWLDIFSCVPLSLTLHRAQCLKTWNHCEDLMQSCRIIFGLLGSLSYNHLNGLPWVVRALGIYMKKMENLISITAYFPFSPHKATFLVNASALFPCQNKSCLLLDKRFH